LPALREWQARTLDFDFEIGKWRTHLRRLVHPLTGSTTWVEYDGITVVSKEKRRRGNENQPRMNADERRYETRIGLVAFISYPRSSALICG
jgi:hypothetical protein